MASSVEELFEIIYEDDELLVVNKAAGLVCHPTKNGETSSLIGRARLHLGPDSHPQLVNRLDRETSGVTVIAKSAAAARELRRLWEDCQVEKVYWAIVHGYVRETHGVIKAPLGKDEHSRVAVKDCVRPDGAPATTEYWVLRHHPTTQSLAPAANHALVAPELDQGGSRITHLSRRSRKKADHDPSSTIHHPPSTLLRVQLHTGRKHQIRIHLAHIGHPIVGDKLYGGDEDLYMALVENRLTAEQRQRLVFPNHALHARELRLHWRGHTVAFRAELEAWFAGWLTLAFD